VLQGSARFIHSIAFQPVDLASDPPHSLVQGTKRQDRTTSGRTRPVIRMDMFDQAILGKRGREDDEGYGTSGFSEHRIVSILWFTNDFIIDKLPQETPYCYSA
jgi:hypothetical protein